jgi:hypothetical protein
LLPSDQKNGLKKMLATTTTPFLQAEGNMILTLILCTIKYISFSGPHTTYIKELFSCFAMIGLQTYSQPACRVEQYNSETALI